ncbi:MAG TPA: alpha/beta hydrolase [Thermoflexales bacterium]|nr:alpha/beta hydrolase [Thermoflexales bacterium]HQW34338.1 alpha/beta hydrolase [Thermoflexales bacterium]HQX76864.1 alpha/beta hydrolase [Thermoflexales bacterium]HQZ21934.1 alpha/beta hydrolase [Thermoflexales bacterium]HQZ98816.1 alpha/beta hydrolase [Thermoflexales bacterium]
MKNKKLKRIFLLAPLALILLAALGFVGWASLIPAPMPEAMQALNSTAQVKVETQNWLVFRPAQTPSTGLIFYPGGRVDARAYAPYAQAIAAQGYLVVIPPMPLNLAIFGVDKAAQIQAAFPEIKRWAIGGHSLGGSMAATFVAQHQAQMQGLVFWASYPADGALANSAVKVVSVSASRDGLATPDKIQASRANLPPGTTWVVIEGGDHAQFGWYGDQAGDNPAQISRADQQAQTVKATVDLLKSLGN